MTTSGGLIDIAMYIPRGMMLGLSSLATHVASMTDEGGPTLRALEIGTSIFLIIKRHFFSSSLLPEYGSQLVDKANPPSSSTISPFGFAFNWSYKSIIW